jgi:hypothetical protein
MSDYIDSINPSYYTYKKPVYYTNPFSTDKTNLIVKLILDSSNFNFDLAQEDGSDFRLVDYDLGVGILHTWVAMWNKDNRHAVLFFKIPYISAQNSVTFYAYWGSDIVEAITDPSSVGFIFYEDFSSNLSSSKWSGDLTSTVTDRGFYVALGNSFVTNTSPLYSLNSWTFEAGVYASSDTYSGNLSYFANKLGFIGTYNDFYIKLMHSSRIQHNITEPAGTTEETVDATYGGLELDSYQEYYVAYSEDDDAVKFSLLNRNSYSDYSLSVNRKVEGDTVLSNIEIYGPADGRSARPFYIDWCIVREYDGITTSSLDGSSLYIPYEDVNHQAQDYRMFSDNIVATNYKHTSSIGGSPENISSPLTDSLEVCWVSDATISGGEVVIYMDRTENLVSTTYKHYDSEHSYLYYAARLSDSGDDVYNRTYWRNPTSSGWAAIRFDSPTNVATFSFDGLSGYLDSRPKDIDIYGSNYFPGAGFYGAKLIKSDTLYTTISGLTDVTHTNNRESYKYYIVDVKNTYGDIIRIAEWYMYSHVGRAEKYYISQLRLTPASYGSADYNFPKEISLQCSSDGENWYTILDWTNTYTPFVEHYMGYGREQRYTITTVRGAWMYKLLCRDNWAASDNKIIIGSWGLYELYSETYTYRVLEGSSNDIKQIWADADTKLNDIHKTVYLANDKLNKVSDNFVYESEDMVDNYIDFNVV